jgi:hypothetical protein
LIHELVADVGAGYLVTPAVGPGVDLCMRARREQRTGDAAVSAVSVVEP